MQVVMTINNKNGEPMKARKYFLKGENLENRHPVNGELSS